MITLSVEGKRRRRRREKDKVETFHETTFTLAQLYGCFKGNGPLIIQ